MSKELRPVYNPERQSGVAQASQQNRSYVVENKKYNGHEIVEEYGQQWVRIGTMGFLIGRNLDTEVLEGLKPGDELRAIIGSYTFEIEDGSTKRPVLAVTAGDKILYTSPGFDKEKYDFEQEKLNKEKRRANKKSKRQRRNKKRRSYSTLREESLFSQQQEDE